MSGRIELAEDAAMPFLHRLQGALEAGLLIVVRYGIAIVLLGVIARFTLTELVTPPILKYVATQLEVSARNAETAAKAVGPIQGFLELLVDRGVLPNAQKAGALPAKTEWQRPFVLEDKQ